MSRYIDADALFKAFENAAWYNNADRDDVAEELLLDAPTVDAVPVVRCEDCKHHDTVSLNCEFLAATTLDNCYCWNGERKDEENESKS